MNEERVKIFIQKDTTTPVRPMDDRYIFTDAWAGDDKTQFTADIEPGDLTMKALSRDNVAVRIYDSTGILTALDSCDWLYEKQHIQGYYRTIPGYAEREGVW
jgi:hypothetical protein